MFFVSPIPWQHRWTSLPAVASTSFSYIEHEQPGSVSIFYSTEYGRENSKTRNREACSKQSRVASFQ